MRDNSKWLPLPDMNRLLGTQTRGDVTVTLLSIKGSVDGYIGDFLISLAGAAAQQVDFHHLLVTGTDTCGNNYKSRRWWGSGEMTSEGCYIIRRLMIFSPALDPSASALCIEMTAILRERWELAGRPGARGRLIELESLQGPWTFTIPMPPTDET